MRREWLLSPHGQADEFSLSVPIIYEPRAYLPPRRLRQLTTSDALNPGWRTIRLTGGSPVKDTTPPSPGVEVTLLLPSPPILFVAHDGIPPPIPFHLHFHSPVTLPLATFSDPRQSTFVIRLMRVTMIRISTEKEIRRMELKSKIEVWQEGSPRITLGEERPVGGTHGANGTGRQYSSHAAATPVTGATGRRPSTSGGERRRSFSERRSSFLRRRPSTEPAALEPEPTPVTQSNGPTIPPITEEPQEELPPSASPDERIAPLPLDATDVHLMAQLTISPSTSGGSMTALRTLVQSFTTPEISISYVLEVGLQPKKGAVREAFSHVWGGGLVEVVLGAR